MSANEEMELLLYGEDATPTSKDKMILYDVRDNRKDFFSFPKEIFAEDMGVSGIRVDTLANNFFEIEYHTQNGVKRKRYIRQ